MAADVKSLHMPHVAIVGRSNVGKSTLFNRLARERIAITASQAGVTRDLFDYVCMIDDFQVRLHDSGGVWLDSDRNQDQALHQAVTGRSLSIVDDADLLIILFDVLDFNALDQQLLEYIRPRGERIIAVVNKVDTSEREDYLGEFYSIGIKTIIPISAEHGRNIDALTKIISRKLYSLGFKPGIQSTDVAIKLAIVGQPNTGKSSLLNALTNEDKALVSDIAGTTRDVIRTHFFHDGLCYEIADTAGMRRKRNVTGALEYYSVHRALQAVARVDVVLILIDAELGITDQDKKIARSVVEHGRGLILLLNKWDLLPPKPNRLIAMQDRMRFLFPILEFAPILAISAKQKTGFDSLLKTISVLYEQLNKRISTGVLNRKLQDWITRHPPPRRNRRNYKFRYITQAGINPIEFVLFMNNCKGLPESYLGYIRNRIRSELGFSSIPFNLLIRDKIDSPML